MKIADAETFVVENPPPHHGGRYWVFLKLTTDGGVEGVEILPRLADYVFDAPLGHSNARELLQPLHGLVKGALNHSEAKPALKDVAEGALWQ